MSKRNRIVALRAVTLECEFDKINLVVGIRGSVVGSDFYTKLKKLVMYKKERMTNSLPTRIT